MEQTDLFGTEKISKILLKLAPPVMLAQLIQALYNIIDSLFVGRYSDWVSAMKKKPMSMPVSARR